jgi:hypothetical protein
MQRYAEHAGSFLQVSCLPLGITVICIQRQQGRRCRSDLRSSWRRLAELIEISYSCEVATRTIEA